MNKYYLYYNKNTNMLVDIKENNSTKQFNYITINESEFKEIMQALNDGLICKVKNSKFYIEKNENLIRDYLTKKQDELFGELFKFLDNTYQSVLNLSDSDIEILNKYKLDVLNIIKAFEISNNKQDFYLKFVENENFENILNSDLIEYKLKKPSFIK